MTIDEKQRYERKLEERDISPCLLTKQTVLKVVESAGVEFNLS